VKISAEEVWYSNILWNEAGFEDECSKVVEWKKKPGTQ
jgi:hypothetical protein